MKKQLNPAVSWVIIITLVVVVVGVAYSVLGPKPINYDAKGSEQLMDKVKNGGKMYDPPGKKTPSGGFVPPGQN